MTGGGGVSTRHRLFPQRKQQFHVKAATQTLARNLSTSQREYWRALVPGADKTFAQLCKIGFQAISFEIARYGNN